MFPGVLGSAKYDISGRPKSQPGLRQGPYGPDREAKTIDEIKIEERDPQEVLEARGLPTTDSRVSGYYPAFDVTPPALITGLITDRGLFAPDDTWGYYETQTPE